MPAFVVSYAYDQPRNSGMVHDKEDVAWRCWATVFIPEAKTAEDAILIVHGMYGTAFGPFKVERADDLREIRKVVD